MRSAVGNQVREERSREMLQLTVDERIELALELGRRDVEFYMATNKVDRETAIRELRKITQAGRTPSKSHDEL